MIKTIMTFSLGVIIGIFTLDFILNANNINEDKISQLQLKNDSLLKVNNKLDSLNYNLYKELEVENNNIQVLKEKDLKLTNTLNELNTRLKTLNNKYEKANNYSNNFNSNEISSYFSNLR
jgi:predicted nuclease with TOPRIM domain